MRCLGCAQACPDQSIQKRCLDGICGPILGKLAGRCQSSASKHLTLLIFAKNAVNQRKTGRPVNILLRLLPLGPDRIGRSNVQPAFLHIYMKQSGVWDKFFMCQGELIITEDFMTELGLPDKCQAHGLHPWCSKNAAPPTHSALVDRQYVPQHRHRIGLAPKHRLECRTQA